MGPASHIIQCAPIASNECPTSNGRRLHRRRSTATWSPVRLGARYRRPGVPGPPSSLGPIRAGAGQFHLVTDRLDSGLRRTPKTWRSAPRAPSAHAVSFMSSSCWLFDSAACKRRQGQRQRIGAPAQDSDRPHRTPMGAGAGDLPPALLDHWRDAVLELLHPRDMLTRFRSPSAPEGASLALGRSGRCHGAGELIRKRQPWCFAVELARAKTAAAGLA